MAPSAPTAADVVQNDRLGQYDFAAQRAPRQEPAQDFSAMLDEEPVPYDPDEERRLQEARAARERETAQRFERSMAEKPKAGKAKNNVLKPQEGELDRKGQNVFVDKKNKKLEPFGGKKSALKQSDVDRRKNMRQGARAVTAVVIFLLVGILGFGVKNAFFPPASLSEAEVQQIIFSTTGTSAFPLERGATFAETFMAAYMSYDPTGGAEAAVLQYYTTGRLLTDGRVSYPGFNLSSGYRQTIVQGPVVYQTQPIGASSALYTIGALVEVRDASGELGPSTPVAQAPAAPAPEESTAPVDPSASAAPDDQPTDEPTDEPAPEETTESSAPRDTTTGSSNTASGTKLMWQFFAVNVYYDEARDAFAIVGTPALVPTPSTVPASEVPADSLPGNGRTASAETVQALRPTIYGFLEAYRASSSDDYDRLLPYLPSEPSPALLKGLNDEFVFKSGAADDRSVQITVYETDIPTEWRASLTVTWTQSLGGSTADYVSTYLMTINEVGDGYDVTRFIPTIYAPTP